MFSILVVEDDFGARKLMSIVLKNNGYTPLTAENSQTAFQIFNDQHPDLILADVMLPDFDGFKLTEKIRSIDKDVPIIIVTAKSSMPDKRYGFIVGADDYMTKPVDEEELLLRIKALLRRSKNNSEQKLTVDNTELDYSKMSLKINGNETELTQKEFLLVFKLVSSIGKIFTRNELMQEIWGNTEKDDHTLNVHVNRLREKLSESNIEIKSVRGLGYKAVKKNET